jgi:hypothetical protein
VFEILFIGSFVFILFYVLFFSIFPSSKTKKDFTSQVYQYLARRYPNTTIVDFGSISSDPIILSHNAGPFKLIEIKGITEKKPERDLDLIVRGEVDPGKFQKGGINVANLSLYLQSRWGQVEKDIEIGIPRFDDHYIILSDNTRFARHLLTNTSLTDLLRKSFDLEGFDIRWEGNIPVIQIRMETLTPNSFIQAFTTLLGTVGALSEQGYLVGKFWKDKTPLIQQERSKQIWSSPNSSSISKRKKIENLESINDTQEEISTFSKGEEIVFHSPPIPSSESIEINGKLELISNNDDIQSLFSSIRYQAKKIDFTPPTVKILTFSTTTKEIIANISTKDKIQFSTFYNRSPEIEFEMIIESQKSSRSIDWNDCWKDISISGPVKVVEKLKIRTGIANRIANIGQTTIVTKGRIDSGIDIKVTIPRSKEGVNAGYSLIKDIAWFFEMIFI